MRRLTIATMLLLTSLWASTACSTNKPLAVEELPPATAQCKTNCVMVSKEFVKEHGRLFARVIRLKAAIKLLMEKPE